MLTAKKYSRRFSLPNEIYTLDLAPGEREVYSYLLFLEDRHTYTCHPSYQTIGKAVGMSKNTVKKYVDGLAEKRLITVAPTTLPGKNGRPRNANLLYTILPIQVAMDWFYQRQGLKGKAPTLVGQA